MKKKVSAISAIMLERNLRSTTESTIEYLSVEATPPISTHNWPILDYDGASTSPRRAWQHGPTKCAARHAYTLTDTTERQRRNFGSERRNFRTQPTKTTNASQSTLFWYPYAKATSSNVPTAQTMDIDHMCHTCAICRVWTRGRSPSQPNVKKEATKCSYPTDEMFVSGK